MNQAQAEKILTITSTGLHSYTRSDLKRIYRRLAKQYHPDFCQDDHTPYSDDAAAQMAQINEAYDYLLSRFDELAPGEDRLQVDQTTPYIKDVFGWAHSTADNSANTAHHPHNNDAHAHQTPWNTSATSSDDGRTKEPSQVPDGAHHTHAQHPTRLSDAWYEMTGVQPPKGMPHTHTPHHEDTSPSKQKTHRTGSAHHAWNTRSTQTVRYRHYTDAYASTPQARATAFAQEIMSEKHKQARRVIIDAAKTPQCPGKHLIKRFTNRRVARAFWDMTPLRLKVYAALLVCSILIFITALIVGLVLHLSSAYMGLVALLLLLVCFCVTPKPSGIITRMIVRHDHRRNLKRTMRDADDVEVIDAQANDYQDSRRSHG